MITSWNLYLLILCVTIPLRNCQIECQFSQKSKREAASDVDDDLKLNQVDRFIRSNSKDSKQIGDVVLIMDISTSLSEEDRRNQMNTVRSLGQSKVINIGPDNVRIGIVTFETQAHLVLKLDQGVSGSAIVDAAGEVRITNAIQYQKVWGTTNFPDAMNLARDEFKLRGRKGITRVALLVTDGYENCLPNTTKAKLQCPVRKDCNEIAEQCPRPPYPQDMCCNRYSVENKPIPCIKSAVFREFLDLRNEGVILAIIGVGKEIKHGRQRLSCWATERYYIELPSYNKLEKKVKDLVTQLLPRDREDDCKCTYYTDEKCDLDDSGRCGHYWYINVTKESSGNGRPCPKESKEWQFCKYIQCNVTFENGGYLHIPEIVIGTTQAVDSSGIAWWLIFIIMLAVLAVILCLAIIFVAICRKGPNRRAVTTGVQPSLIQPISEVPSCKTLPLPVPAASPTLGVERSVQLSQLSVNRYAQPSLRSIDGQQEKASQQKGGTVEPFKKISASRPPSSGDTKAQYGSPTRKEVSFIKSDRMKTFSQGAFHKSSVIGAWKDPSG